MFRALRYRNYRLFFIGQGISLIGTWMQQIAMSWLVYRLTNSAFMLGLVGFSSQIPTFILSPFAGVLIDRYNRHRILIITQILATIQAFLLAFLTLIGVIQIWQIIVLGIFLGCINSFDAPARQSFVIHMVEKKEMLGNAIALNSLMFNAARLIGPSIAGILIAVAGEGVCFVLNGISFFVVIGCLLAMKVKYVQSTVKHPHVLQGLKEGLFYAYKFAPIRYILLLLAVISLMGMSYAILMPVFAKDVLKGGPHTLGFLMAAVGIGALFGTAYLASRKYVFKFSVLIPISSIIFGIALVLFSMSHTLWISLIILLFAGCWFMIHMVLNNTVLQTIVEEDKRGRVMSLHTTAFLGMAPLGSLLAGVLANKLGVESALVISGTCCIMVSLFFASKLKLLKQMAHSVYENMRIVPEVVE